MATKIRLQRGGKKNKPVYRIVVADSRAPRDGKFIEKLGVFNPNVENNQVNMDDEVAFKWVMTGAEPTDTARKILSDRGLLLKKHLQIGVNKGAITQEAADEKFAAWKADKDAKTTAALSAEEKAAADKIQAAADERAKIQADMVAAKKKADEEAVAAAAAAKAEEETAAKAEEEGEEAPAAEASEETTEEA